MVKVVYSFTRKRYFTSIINIAVHRFAIKMSLYVLWPFPLWRGFFETAFKGTLVSVFFAYYFTKCSKSLTIWICLDILYILMKSKFYYFARKWKTVWIIWTKDGPKINKHIFIVNVIKCINAMFFIYVFMNGFLKRFCMFIM